MRAARNEDASYRLISPALLHIFDQTMSMVPFATRTDMIDALKNADVKASAVETFLGNLLLEHSLPNSATQLRRLWVEHARDMYPEEDNDIPEAAGGGAFGAVVATPPGSPPPPTSPK